MAYHKSALKEHHQSRERRLRNRDRKGRMRTAIKKFRGAIAANQVDEATAMLCPILSLVDHTAKLGAIHDKAAARTKSRLQRALNKISA